MGVPGSDTVMAPRALPRMLASADLTVDALVGYGLNGPPREPPASLIKAANAAAAPRLALDVPSGLGGDTGSPYTPCRRADATLTLAWPKAGLLVPEAKVVVGQLYLADISILAVVYRAAGVEWAHVFASGPIMHVDPSPSGWEAGQAVGSEGIG
jgi:hypothetical protein